MPNALPFNRLEINSDTWITIYVEGQAIKAAPDDTVAAAILSAGLLPSRTTPVSNSSRAPYCLMGVCFECLVTIDGIENSQACMTQVKEGMQVHQQKSARKITQMSVVEEYQP